MITIPTFDLLGMSRDALLFTAPAKDFPELARIRYHWDGQTLHVTATNVLTGCHVTWNPAADDWDGHDPWEGTAWGGADDPWTVVIDTDAAKHMIGSLKVSPKLARAPLTVEFDRAHLVVKRSPDTGLPQVANRYTGSLDDFPDVQARIADIGVPKPADELSYTASSSDAMTRVAKRRGMRLRVLPHTQGHLVRVGEGFEAFMRHADE